MRYFKTRTFRMAMLRKNAFRKILMTNLDLYSSEAELIVDYMNDKIMSYAIHRFINTCLLCRKYEIEVKPFEDFPYCLGLLPYTLEHRINMLKDIGVQKVNITQISKLMSHLSTSVSKFKKLTNIPSGEDIRENIFSRLDESPIDVSKLNLNNRMKTKDYYNSCLLHCKTKIFDLPNLDNTVLLKTDIKHKSISMIAETLKVLRLDLGYDNEYITKNPRIILASAGNVKSLLSSFKDTGLIGSSIEKVLKKYPYLLFEDANNVKQLLESFKRYDIPEEYARKFMKIFTLGNDLFVERMGIILKHPDLHLWHKHPRILQLVFYKSMVMDRAEYLRYINRIKWARANTVLSQKKIMDRFVQYGASTLTSPKSLRYLLNSKLKIPLKNIDLIERLMKHPHWKTTGFDDIEKMLDYLMNNFTVDEICQNIHIVLYSRSAVEETLAELRQKYSESTEYSFTNSQYLALCLYILEKDTYFTGDGVWSKGHNVKKQSLSSNPSDSDANVDVLSARISDKIDLNLCDKNETFATTI